MDALMRVRTLLTILFAGIVLAACGSGEPTTTTVGADSAPTEDGEPAGGSRRAVSLSGEAYASTLEATTFDVGVGTCNGGPTFTVEESSEQIWVYATSWVPDPDEGDACLDGIRVELGEAIGDRTIIDGWSGRPVTLRLLEQPDWTAESTSTANLARWDWEYEDFAWQGDASDAYAMTYTQTCDADGSDGETTTVWVDGPFTNWVDSDRQDVITIADVQDIIVATSEPSGAVLIEGDLGQPEMVMVVDEAGAPTFCFELVNFETSSRDDADRMAVPLLYDAYGLTPDETTFFVGVASCNGSPTFTLDETEDSVVVNANSRVPDTDGREHCLDGVTVELAEPLGDRPVIDGLSGRIVDFEAE